MLDCVSRVYKEEGPLAYWKGTHAVFWRNSICMLGMVGFYNTVEHCLPAGIPLRALCTGALCGIIGSFMSYPFEMLRCVAMKSPPPPLALLLEVQPLRGMQT